MRRVLIPSHVPDIAPLAPRAAQIVSLSGAAMGTTWSVRIAMPRGEADDVRRLIDDGLALVVSQMSQWDAGSHISRFNRAGPGEWQVLPDEFFHVLQSALSLARDTGGAYDPTIGALSELWGFGAAGARSDIPDAQAVAGARERIGWTRVAIDAPQRKAMQPGALLLDLSSIAKGFAVDLVSEALMRRGLTDHLVEIGGELRGTGTKPDLSPWWVALEDADGVESDVIVALHGVSVATSGNSQRFIAADGRIYAHTIDPRTGWPIDDALASVTVLDRSCMRADALATALSVLGADEGHGFAAARNIAARFLLRGPQGTEERVTPSFEAMLAH